MIKVVYYCIGNFTDFFIQTVINNNEKYDNVFYLQNFKGVETLNYHNKNSSNKIQSRYQYENFNSLFNCKEDVYQGLNYNIILQADKNHFKKKDKNYIKNIITTFAYMFDSWLNIDKPDYIFFPIIESLDAMCLYELCLLKNIQPIVYTHSRILPLSFLSPDKFESLPPIPDNEINKIISLCDTESLINIANKLCSPKLRISNQIKETVECINSKNTEVLCQITYKNPIVRFLNNCYANLKNEKHNQILNNFTKFQVYFERFFVFTQKKLFLIFEVIYLKRYEPKSSLSSFDFFALHFSPESSINTPAPYYIDQLRVVDKILLDSGSNNPLVIREHPSVYGKRPLRFYFDLFKRINVYYSCSKHDIYSIIDASDTVHTVTGTVAIEAFLKNKKYIQYGDNLLSDFMRQPFVQEFHESKKIRLFISTLIYVSGEYLVVPHSSRNKLLNKSLFSKYNINNFNRALNDFIKVLPK